MAALTARWSPDGTGQQPSAEVAPIAPALGNAGTTGDPGRTKRIREQDRDVEPTIGEPVGVRSDAVSPSLERHDPVKRRNPMEDRRQRLRDGHGHGIRPDMPANGGDGRQRHHDVAEPVRRHDDDAPRLAIAVTHAAPARSDPPAALPETCRPSARARTRDRASADASRARGSGAAGRTSPGCRCSAA